MLSLKNKKAFTLKAIGNSLAIHEKCIWVRNLHHFSKNTASISIIILPIIFQVWIDWPGKRNLPGICCCHFSFYKTLKYLASG